MAQIDLQANLKPFKIMDLVGLLIIGGFAVLKGFFPLKILFLVTFLFDYYYLCLWRCIKIQLMPLRM